MTDAIAAVSVEVTVPLPPAEAFELFTSRFGHWWPRDYSYSRETLVAIVLGSDVGDWCFERGPNGFRCDWGRIVRWHPPFEVAFTWHIGPKSVPQPNPDNASVVAVTFAEHGAGQTTVTLKHSEFARHGDGAAQYHAEMASAYGWRFVLQQYVAASIQADLARRPSS